MAVMTLDDLRSLYKTEAVVSIPTPKGDRELKLVAPTAEAVRQIRRSVAEHRNDFLLNFGEMLVQPCLAHMDGLTDEDVMHLVALAGGVESELVRTASDLCGLREAYDKVVNVLNLEAAALADGDEEGTPDPKAGESPG